ncbi:MAG: NUDIX hydrolase [bacterium]|nr:NUDIX hydrolase [bacterium]
MSNTKLEAIEIVEDRTSASRCDVGFLKLSRLVVCNVYADGTRSEPYPCDVVRRPGSDAVVAVLYEISSAGDVHVILRESPRVPIYLRKHSTFEHPDPREYLTLHEVVAGLVEAGDGAGPTGLRKRAAIEALEEAGFELDPEDLAVIGDETFASPGVTDEKIFYCAGGVRFGDAAEANGDGSVMEEWSQLARFELRAAITACRNGSIPDMKTEVALWRLADHVGYLPQLGCFARDLPPELRERYTSLGVERR